MKPLISRGVLASTLMAAPSLWAFENTKVLPKGVRNLTIRSVSTSVDKKADENGELQSIAQPLEKEFTFKKVVDKETGVKRMLLESLITNHISQDESLGKFSADMKGNISVVAPVLTYGLSDNLTLALAVPFYKGKMNVAMAFHPSENAEKFKAMLLDEDSKQTAKAEEFIGKINNAVGELNTKLRDNGFANIENWEGSGIGDTTLAAKYRILDLGAVSLSNTSGVVLPTGRIQDPDVLVSIPFGEGVYSFFTSLAADEPLPFGFFLNQYAKATYVKPDKKEIRLKTSDEAIEVEKDTVSFKAGNRVELGASLQYEPEIGLATGIGYSYFKKYSDRYRLGDHYASQQEWELNTEQEVRYLESKIGYSTINAFKRKQFPIPLSLTLEFKKQLASRNIVMKDLVTFDMALFF